MTQVKDIPYIGAGMGYRRDLRDGTLAAGGELGLLEIVTEHFIQRPRQLDELAELVQQFAIVLHSLNLSVGSATPIDYDYLRSVRRILEVSKAPYQSDHLCMSRMPGINMGHLTPIWLTRSLLELVVRKVDAIQSFLGKPLVLETITYYFEIPMGDISQPAFFRELVERTGCGILMDIANLDINASNHGFDPIAYLEEMPLDHVVQVHLAGGHRTLERREDSHSELVEESTWKLFDALAARTKVKAVILEHDQNFPEFSVLLDEVKRAQRILDQHYGAAQEPRTASATG
jgi:hypothetical protein